MRTSFVPAGFGKRFRRSLLGLALLLALGGAAYIVRGAERIAAARQVVGWPTAPGMMTRSDSHDAGRRINSARGPAIELFARDLTYLYRVGDRSYEGHHVGPFEQPEVSREAAYRDTQRFPAGRPVQVFYDPADPGRSCLDPASDNSTSWAEVGAGLFFLLIAAALWRTARHRAFADGLQAAATVGSHRE
jgi:Protein of unknown function (DUF3592)